MLHLIDEGRLGKDVLNFTCSMGLAGRCGHVASDSKGRYGFDTKFNKSLPPKHSVISKVMNIINPCCEKLQSKHVNKINMFITKYIEK